jgi:hypothetical protein
MKNNMQVDYPQLINQAQNKTCCPMTQKTWNYNIL